MQKWLNRPNHTKRRCHKLMYPYRLSGKNDSKSSCTEKSAQAAKMVILKKKGQADATPLLLLKKF